ncbi:MAG TPA: hypothetical protein VGX68_16480 [Thermoanaerobaculia bacterium]|nr:hypothetical protein [Thermoanaerobaculia bacterium]
MADSQFSLLEQVRSGNRQLQLLAADGFLPLSPEQLIPLQVDLAEGADVEVAERARRSLYKLDPRIAGPFLEHQAGERALAFFAEEVSHPGLIEKILRRRDVPHRVLMRLARRVPPDLQEILLLRQDAIVAEPAILEALEENPQVSSYSQRRIAEYRQHLLPRQKGAVPAPAAPQPLEMDDEELEEAIANARTQPAAGEIDEKTGLSEGQIRLLPVPARLKLARGAPRALRSILLRDSNAQVAVSVLLNNNLSEQEVEQTAANRSVAEEVLDTIAKRREWVNRYSISKALIWNPRTPLPTALRLVPKLSVRDLRDLGRDRNVADAVRSTALRLYRIKQQ